MIVNDCFDYNQLSPLYSATHCIVWMLLLTWWYSYAIDSDHRGYVCIQQLVPDCVGYVVEQGTD